MAWPFTGKTPEYVLSYYDFKNVIASGTSTATAPALSADPLIFGGLTVNGGTMGAITIRDGANASAGTVIANITNPVSATRYEYNVRCSAGLCVFASAATNYTLQYIK